MKQGVLAIGLGAFLWLIFLLFQAQGIYGGDSGDLVTAAVLLGVPHPPGYPLYTLLANLISRLPHLTPAWRVGLLSSLPHAATAVLIYLLVRRLTGKLLPAILSAGAAVGNYVFFLYAVTPEVFALFDLFLILLIYLLVVWAQTGRSKYLYLASLVFGLALAHHHVILFSVPGMAYWLWVNRKRPKAKPLIRRAILWRCLGLVVLGLLPYFYLPLAGQGNAIINWDRPVNVSNFIRLITRADYGTFISSGFYGTLPSQRLLQLKAYFQFFLMDFTWVGAVLALSGAIRLGSLSVKYLWFWLVLVVFLGPGFFFYASFPLMNRFTLGTYERFLLPTYVLLYPLVGLGVWQVDLWWQKLAKRALPRVGAVAGVLVMVILSLYPLATVGMSFWRFWGLSSDRTADNLGRDILQSVPAESILFVGRDTALFATQYVRYALGVRPDVMVIHFQLMWNKEYLHSLAKVFPQLVIPEGTDEVSVGDIIKANREKFPIYANMQTALEAGWFWVPQGLVYRLAAEADLPAVSRMHEDNRQLWQQYHDPGSGILGRYNHLMLSDVRDVYAVARVSLGKTLLRAGLYNEASEQFTQAVQLGGDTELSDAYVYRGLSQFFLKNCQAALADFSLARQTTFTVEKKLLSLYEATTYQDCLGDQEQAKTIFAEYEKLRAEEETPLVKP